MNIRFFKQLHYFLFPAILFNNISAQTNPVNIRQTIPQNLNVCEDTSTLEVRMAVLYASADNAKVRVTFLTGISYVPRLLAINPSLTNNGLKLIEDDISNLNSSFFRIEPVKSNYRLTRSFYKGILGDNINKMLTTVGFTFKKRMNKWTSSFCIFQNQFCNRVRIFSSITFIIKIPNCRFFRADY